ncbi:hypothetical protein ACHAQH_007384 [Verticillium albo-atrum]
MASAQTAYEQNRSVIPGVIPGLAFEGGRSSDASAKRSEQPVNGTKRQPAGDTAEEGELSEGEYDDLYEPAAPGHLGECENDGYETGEHAWYEGAADARDGGARDAVPVDAPAAGRDSYSPYLSPHEIQPALRPGAPRTVPRINDQLHQSVPSRATVVSPTAPSADVLSEAKDKARSAILSLWSLDLRYDDFVSEGMDKDLVRMLFNDLGLETDSESPAAKDVGPGSQIPGLTSSIKINGASAQINAQISKPHPRQPFAPANGSTNGPATTVVGKAEERKDRIARLLAAKQALSSTAAAASSQGSAGAEGTDVKQLKLQQKMEALQKSREARAQKAASRKSSVAAQPSPSLASHGLPSVRPTSEVVTSTPTHPLPAKVDIAAPDTARSVIPGLFLSSTSQQIQSPNNQRKRPVAADFDDYAQTNSHKRPSGPSYQSKLVIDVSEGSDDDIEMEIGSGDESNTNVQPSDTPSRWTTSFRDLPALSETANQRPFSNAVYTRVATPPGHLAVMDKQIEAMKRKIALAEARKKLKIAMSGNNGQATVSKSGVPTPDAAVVDSDSAIPSLRRVQSMDPLTSLDGDTTRSSPATPVLGSVKLPKNPDLAKSGVDRSQRVRVLSQNLPGMQSRLQAKRSKLRLLQSQMTRLEREIEHEDAEKRSAEEELNGLQEQVASDDHDVSHSPTREAPEPPTEQSLVDDAQIALQPGSTIADESSQTKHAGASPSSPSLGPEDDSAKAAESASGSGAEASHGAQVETHVPAQESSAFEKAAKVSETSNHAEEPASSAFPVSTASDTDAGDLPENPGPLSPTAAFLRPDSRGADEDSHSGLEGTEMQLGTPSSAEADDTMAIIQDDDVLPLTDQETDSSSNQTRSLPAQISVGIDESNPDEGLNNNARPSRHDGRPSSEHGFAPYESPFQLFRNYRYHPDYQNMVAGGLRSLTYSNKIDPNLPVCPDQLDGRKCPKGSECEYQHFESMKLPDDQILLQLGGTNIEGPERVQYNNGLRELLQDMRQRNIKDFPSIAQGIVDYHNRFTGDPSRILTLGDVLI